MDAWIAWIDRVRVPEAAPGLYGIVLGAAVCADVMRALSSRPLRPLPRGMCRVPTHGDTICQVGI